MTVGGWKYPTPMKIKRSLLVAPTKITNKSATVRCLIDGGAHTNAISNKMHPVGGLGFWDQLDRPVINDYRPRSR